MRLRRALIGTLAVGALVGALILLGPVLVPEIRPNAVVTAGDCVRQWNDAPPVGSIDAEIVYVQPQDGWEFPSEEGTCTIAWNPNDEPVAVYWAPNGGFVGRQDAPADVPRWDQLRANSGALEGVHAVPEAGGRLRVSGNRDWSESTATGSD